MISALSSGQPRQVRGLLRGFIRGNIATTVPYRAGFILQNGVLHLYEYEYEYEYGTTRALLYSYLLET